MESQHSTKFGGYKHCINGDIGILDLRVSKCHVALWIGANDLTKPRNQRIICLYSLEPLKSIDPTKVGSHQQCGSGDIMVLVCHAILQDLLMKRSCNLMRKAS